jgi:hypothetical protein
VRLDPFPYPNDLVTKLLLQLSKIFGLADGIRHNDINFRSFKSVRDVVCTGYVKWEACRYVGFWLRWERGTIGFSLCCHIAVRPAGSQVRPAIERNRLKGNDNDIMALNFSNRNNEMLMTPRLICQPRKERVRHRLSDRIKIS